MKKLKKIVLWLVIILVIAIGGFAGVAFLVFPKVSDAPELTIEATPEMIERGEYLANHVSVCMDCHSERDWTLLNGPPKPGTAGKGGEYFGKDMGLPANVYSQNITPHGISDWTDGELFRVITTGVKKDGEPMFDIMPTKYYANMSENDLYAIIAYIRSLKPINYDAKTSEVDFPVSMFMRFAPKDYEPKTKPSTSDQVAYGEYVFNQAACGKCHTPITDKGQAIEELRLAGGFEFKFPNGNIVRSANITTDSETGIGNWTEEAFVQRFKMYADSGYTSPKIAPTDFNSVMPWVPYSGMKDSDLRAIYAYLKTVDPIKNEVIKFTPASN